MSSKFAIPVMVALCPAVAVLAQTEPVVGLRDNTPRVYALTDARIVVAPGNVVEGGTLVIRNGVIEAAGAGVTPPPDAVVRKMQGRSLYAGFIDLYTDLGMPEPPRPLQRGGPPGAPGQVPEETTSAMRTADPRPRGAVHWNPQVTAFVEAVSEFAPDEEKAKRLRSQGFTTVLAVPKLGIFRGQSALISLNEGSNVKRIVRSGVAQHVSFQRTQALGGDHPMSLMGAIALIRQTWLDADWYLRAHEAYALNPRGVPRPEKNSALAALADAARGRQPVVFEVTDEENFLRAARIGEEFSLHLWIRGSGSEYRMLEAVRAAGVPVILPLNFPERPDVDTPEKALRVSLSQLRHWDAAPENPGRLERAEVEFALTSDQLRNADQFLSQLRRAVARGLSRDGALAALTTVPARWLGLPNQLGTLEPGKAANVVVADGDIFADNTAVREVWVEGKRFEVEAEPAADPRGRWEVTVANSAEPKTGVLEIGGRLNRLSGSLTVGERRAELASVQFTVPSQRLSFRFKGDDLDIPGTVTASASVAEAELSGVAETPAGEIVSWTASRSAGSAEPQQTAEEERRREGAMASLPDVLPAMEYGRDRPPEQPEHVLVRNATLWTMGTQGKLENADLLVGRGKIVRVGRNLSAPAGAVVVDATGKHLTPGLIDPHLHSGISGGVNEMGNAVVPEVRIGDVLSINNIWMYRQLAGGLTSAHLKHGSANPIGGQNALIKLRWGHTPDRLLIEGAPRTVKFALGENVKRRSGRYPDTRMGTEQIIRDSFKAARDYERAWGWENNGGLPPRRDLRMEALVEILKGDILIQSHCYRQDEILMLMRVAEEFGTRVKSFHHTVEAYKIADELARHGAGAVVWSDWGAFKVEAYDATLYNARLTHEQGVVTSLHSDNSQIAARMNWEAGKMLRAGMKEEDALSLVTLNPARLLGIDPLVGSLEPGKDADFVIWSGHPLSAFSVCEQTWIDGARFYDITEDKKLQERVRQERAALIQKALEADREGDQRPRPAGPTMRRPGESDLGYLDPEYDADYSCTEVHHE